MEVLERLLPDPSLSRAEMEARQRTVAETARFEDDLRFDPDGVTVPEPIDDPEFDFEFDSEVGDPADPSDPVDPGDPAGQSDPSDSTPGDDPGDDPAAASDRPTVAGVDQAFLDDRAVGVAVALRDGRVVDRGVAVADLAMPYVPGLLSFREGRPALAALRALSVDPDLIVVDGSGRIHYRQAGLATHLGVLVDRPSVGVAKSLLCGRQRRSVEGGLPEGEWVAIDADDQVEGAGPETTIGHAVQTRQYDSPNRHVNPVYVSPGHRTSAATAADLVERTAAGYKLPEPTRLADRGADRAKRSIRRREN